MSTTNSTSKPPQTQPPTRTISFGLLTIPFQALDMIGPMDILTSLTHEQLSQVLPISPPNFYPFPIDDILSHSPSITFHHIGPTLDPVETSGRCSIKPTTTFADCPKLDYLLIGGPGPEYFGNLPVDAKKFILERSKEVNAIFTTCTGGLVLAATGLLDGLPATANHFCIPPIGTKMFPKVKWDTDRHWVVVKPDDEDVKKRGEPLGCEVWTSAGAGAGMDMMAHWVRTEFGEDVGRKLLGISTSLLEWRPNDVDGRPLDYVNGRGEILAA